MNIKAIEQIFEKNLNDEYLEKAISKIISYEITKSQKEVDDLRKDLNKFEKRFSMTSADFFKKYTSGKLEDSADFFEWSSLFQMYKRVSERLNILRTE